MEQKTYLYKRKIFTIIILITVYSAFVGYLLGNLQSIADWNYSIHEILYIPYNIAYYVFPIELCFWIYYAVKSIKESKDKNTKAKNKIYIKNSLLFVSVITIILCFYIQSMNLSTGGLFEVETKYNERNNYYVMMNNKKIKCSKNEYNLIEEGKVYLVNFTWNSNSPEKGKLEYIEQTDILLD
jgi:hypothetical protein